MTEDNTSKENFEILFKKSLKNTEMRIGKIIKAKIILLKKEFVYLDAGLKSESILPISQFQNDSEDILHIGNNVDVVLESLDNGFGETRLSREKAKKIEIWNHLDKCFTDKISITGKVINNVRGGFTVEIEGLRAFLPGSLVDVRPIRDICHIEGKTLEFKIVKLDLKRNNIVVSRKAVIEAETKEDRETLLSKLKEESIVKGIVKNITDFGVFIDLGGIDGLLHITDMSWSRIKHPSDLLSVGQEVVVKVIKFIADKGRISLGLKQLENDPWTNVENELSVGTKLIGKVTNITDYGCFVKLKEGIEGLVHTSEMDWTNKNPNPRNIVKVDQEIEITVLEVDSSRHRISLGMKQCIENPWQAFNRKHQVGDKVFGKIRSITDFGIFIGLDGNIDGLIHISDVSWSNQSKNIKSFKNGDTIEAVMLSINVECERIALSIKQLSKDPLLEFYKNNKPGKTVNCKVVSLQKHGIFLSINEDIDGFIKYTEIPNYKEENFEVNNEINLNILNIDFKRRTVYLTLLKQDISGRQKHRNTYYSGAMRSSKNNYQDRLTPITIGDLIKEKLNNK